MILRVRLATALRRAAAATRALADRIDGRDVAVDAISDAIASGHLDDADRLLDIYVRTWGTDSEAAMYGRELGQRYWRRQRERAR